MADLEFNKETDQAHVIKLDSYLISASWCESCAYAGFSAAFEVRTALVGNGATIKITGKTAKGKKLGKLKDTISGNLYRGEFDIPDNIGLGDEAYFEVSLPKLGLNGESNKIPVLPLPKIKSIGWSSGEARRGDIVTLSAKLENVDDLARAKVVIYEYDSDGAHDRIVELPAEIKDGKIEIKWEYEYHEDTDEIPSHEEMQKYGGSYSPPEYFFTIKINGFEVGKKQESGLLKFKDWLNVTLRDIDNYPLANQKCKVILPDNSEKDVTTDDKGTLELKDIPPGKIKIKLVNYGDDD